MTTVFVVRPGSNQSTLYELPGVPRKGDYLTLHGGGTYKVFRVEWVSGAVTVFLIDEE